MKAITQKEIDEMVRSGVIKEQKLYYPDNHEELIENEFGNGAAYCKHNGNVLGCKNCRLCVGNYIAEFEYMDSSCDSWDCILHDGVKEQAGAELTSMLLAPISIEYKLKALEL